MTQNRLAREREDMQKVTLNLRRGDYEFLNSLSPRVPASRIIRRIVSAQVDALRQRTEGTTPDVPGLDV